MVLDFFLLLLVIWLVLVVWFSVFHCVSQFAHVCGFVFAGCGYGTCEGYYFYFFIIFVNF